MHWYGFDPHAFIKNTYIVEQAELRDPIDYDNIFEDLENDRFIYLTGGDQYYDTYKRKFCKPKEIDTMYLRDKELRKVKPKSSATEFLQRLDIPFVDEIAFAAGKPFIFSKGRTKYLNRYIPPSIQEYKGIDDVENCINIFRDHIRFPVTIHCCKTDHPLSVAAYVSKIPSNSIFNDSKCFKIIIADGVTDVIPKYIYAALNIINAFIF